MINIFYLITSKIKYSFQKKLKIMLEYFIIIKLNAY
jgi:hypothetical protein